MALYERVKNVFRNITLEPVYFLFMAAMGMTVFTSQELYLMKACKVNLNFTESLCENINNHTDIQIATQKYVSEIQAYNGILQSLPAVLFTLYAGPLSDKYGRKPLILVSFAGYFLLNLVFLINSYWFYELKVEYLLFECLQDVTGGEIVFGLGMYSLMADITTEDNRTKRMAVLDAFKFVGIAIGFVSGGIIKKRIGWTPLYLTSMALIIIDILYVIIFVKESRKPKQKDQSEKENKEDLSCWDQFCALVKLSLLGFKSLFKQRPSGGRIWIISFVFTMNIQRFAESGGSVINLMFFKIQYNADMADISYLMMFFSLLTIISQLVIVPVLSGRLKFRDTTIIIFAMSTSIIGYLIFALSYDLTFLLIGYVFWAFYANITTTSRSCLTKLVNPSEIGSVLGIVGIFQSLLSIVSKPFYGFLYKSTVAVFPATYLFVSISLFSVALVTLIVAHVGLKKRQVEMEALQLKNENEKAVTENLMKE